MKKSPSFQFFSCDWLSSRAVRLMDAEQRGWYIQLLAEAWESRPQATLPDEDLLLRELAKVNSSSTDVEKRWAVVKAQFIQRDNLLVNERLLEEVVRQEENRQKKSDAGKASAEARRHQQETYKNQHLSEHAATGAQPNRCSTGVEERSDSVPTESNLSLSSSLSPSGGEEAPKKRRSRRRPLKEETSVPDIFAVTDAMRAWAIEKTPDLDVDLQTEMFLNKCRSKGWTAVDWHATWRTWMLKAQGWLDDAAKNSNGVVRSSPEARAAKDAELARKQGYGA